MPAKRTGWLRGSVGPTAAISEQSTSVSSDRSANATDGSPRADRVELNPSAEFVADRLETRSLIQRVRRDEDRRHLPSRHG
jgi:hypothetical protein